MLVLMIYLANSSVVAEEEEIEVAEVNSISISVVVEVDLINNKEEEKTFLIKAMFTN